MQVVMGEALDGHTWGCWRDLLGVALPWLFADSFRPREVRPFERPEPPEPTHPSEPETLLPPPDPADRAPDPAPDPEENHG